MDISINDTFSISEQTDRAKSTVDFLYAKYASNPYMLSKAHNYICNQLPTILDNIRQAHEDRAIRIEEMTNDQDAFIQSFLNNNQYFYICTTDKYFYYDGIHYQPINEDDILYNVLSSISRDRQLMSWKQRTKINIMKRIRDNSLLKSIPESDTIQYVLDLLSPSLFPTRSSAKYFLTILGDNILKKNTNLAHFLTSKSKMFIQELNSMCQLHIGIGLTQTFKHKYHDHCWDDCRIIKINESVKTDAYWQPIIRQHILDILCIACHYSNRYSSSDDYITQYSNDEELSRDVFYLKFAKHEELIDTFTREYLDLRFPISQSNSCRNSPQNSPSQSFLMESMVGRNVNSLDSAHTRIVQGNEVRTETRERQRIHSRITQITWKNMQYLWKQFLDSKNIPFILGLVNLKGRLVEKLADYYNEEYDSFLGICSKFLPIVQKTLQFWEETMTYDENESDLEIEEITVLFRRWCEMRQETCVNIRDKQILDIISYFFPNIEIDRNKYLSKMRCSLWDKGLDIQIALNNMREQLKIDVTDNSANPSSLLQVRNISIYDAYLYYCNFYSSMINNANVRGKSLIVGKCYFEKYVAENMSEYVIDSHFISNQWILSM
jgi:hypothetical protein